MKNLTFKITLIFFLFLFLNNAFGQGCSDAGFCTMDNFKPNSDHKIETTNNQIKIGGFWGKADYSISAYGSYLEYNRVFDDNYSIDLKLTSLAQNGNDISVFGLSDLFLSGNYRAGDNINLTIGTKIPLSKSDKSLDDLPLPMDYQSSLGTFDLILGIGYKINKFQLVAAIQQPLTQNENQYFSSLYPEDSPLREFQSTNKFVRSGDVLLRVSYPFSLSNNFNLTLSLLPIYHLTNDKYTDELNVEKEIEGSKGLTLNGNIYFDYEINRGNALQLSVGAPFIVRDARPDGLTRSFIANLEYRIKF